MHPQCRGPGPLASALCLLLLASRCEAATSSLWGTDGTPWQNAGGAASDLSDFSFAGVHFGEATLPDRITNKRATVDFGAAADGVTDDTAALQAALDALVPGDALLLPAGTYKLESPIFLRTKNVTIRGAGIGKTTIKPTRSLFDVYGQGTCNAGTNKGYGWCKGFFEIDSTVASYTTLATVTATAARGSTTLSVDSSASLAVGQEIYLRMTDDGSQSMYRYLLGAGAPADTRTLSLQSFSARVESKSATTVALNRPLPFDVRPAWSPTLRPAGKTVEFVVLEDLSFEFPAAAPYPGHHQGEGFNAIEMTHSRHSVVRRVSVSNADLAINLRSSYQCEGVISHLPNIVPRCFGPLWCRANPGTFSIGHPIYPDSPSVFNAVRASRHRLVGLGQQPFESALFRRLELRPRYYGG
jgi:Pectate lyase superfamily protein